MLSERAGAGCALGLIALGLIEILASANGVAGAGTSGEALGGLSSSTRTAATIRNVLRPFHP
jgi:hypothetical protein